MPLEYALQYQSVFPIASTHQAQPVQRIIDLNEDEGTSGLHLDEILPQQHTRISVLRRSPHYFNVMVVGESGLGKTTFMNTLFHSDLYQRTAESIHGLDQGGKGPTLSIQPTTFGTAAV
jgi:putative ribosome biogenesis GTPase RsgA